LIVDCAVYEGGVRRDGELPLGMACRASQADGAFVWLGVVEPSAEEFDAIAREFDLHELAVEDAIDAHQRPKLELYGRTLLAVVKTAHYVEDEQVIDVGELVIFVNPEFVITVRHGHGGLGPVRERLERRPDLLDFGPGAVLYGILDRVIDDYETAAHGVDLAIQDVESAVFSAERENPAERIYNLEREVLEFHRAVSPFAAEVDQLARGHFDVIPPPLRDYFRDVHDHLRRVGGQVGGFRELLASALQANLTQTAVRQNEDMRRISAWVAILAIPTLVAGIYGMNFDHMPELHWRYGYPAVVLAVLMACVLLHHRFKRQGWL